MQIKAKLMIDSIYRTSGKLLDGKTVPCIQAGGTIDMDGRRANTAFTNSSSFHINLARLPDGSDPVRVGQELDVTIDIPDSPINDGRLDQATQMP